MTAPTQDYRDLLKELLGRRCQLNPRYSLRAFARDLGLSPSRLSGLLAKKQGLSRQKATEIARRLNFSTGETEQFCDVVESLHARSRSQRSAATQRLTSTPNPENPRFALLRLDQFRIISDWHHLAILELMLTKDFKPNQAWIAKRLGVPVIEVKHALERLIHLGFVERRGTALRLARDSNATPSDIPSEAIQQFHRQILAKALAALETQGVEERDFSAMIFAVPGDRIQEAKKELRVWRRKFCVEFEKASRKDEVYCLATQFFRMTQPEEKQG